MTLDWAVQSVPAGDINGDRLGDMIIGAPDADSNGVSAGSSYVIFGGSFKGQATLSGAQGVDKVEKAVAGSERFVMGESEWMDSGMSGEYHAYHQNAAVSLVGIDVLTDFI